MKKIGRKITEKTEDLEIFLFNALFEKKQVKIKKLVDEFLKKKKLTEDDYSIESALKRATRLMRKIRDAVGEEVRSYTRHKPLQKKTTQSHSVSQFVLFR